MTALRLIIFTLLIPGTIAVYIPRWLMQTYPARFEIGGWQYTGVCLMLVGFGFYLLSAFAFLMEGGGTPAIWFSRSFRFLIGEEPTHLVRGTLYQFTRNPMYIGVGTFILGEAVWFEARVLLAYAFIVWVCFHLVVIFIEEPHLRNKNGAAYDEFCRAVPRWIGFRKR
jgi:protein-S-isoprenylcysteine O-methyltransferase Ste14